MQLPNRSTDVSPQPFHIMWLQASVRYVHFYPVQAC